MWYVPQGLNVWEQVICEFPGHYARDGEQCNRKFPGPDEHVNRFDGPAWNPPKIYFKDHEPIEGGSVEDRLGRMSWAIAEGDKAEAYGLFLGLAKDPANRHRLKDAILFSGIIDLQDTIRWRNTGIIVRPGATISFAAMPGTSRGQRRRPRRADRVILAGPLDRDRVDKDVRTIDRAFMELVRPPDDGRARGCVSRAGHSMDGGDERAFAGAWVVCAWEPRATGRGAIARVHAGLRYLQEWDGGKAQRLPPSPTTPPRPISSATPFPRS